MGAERRGDGRRRTRVRRAAATAVCGAVCGAVLLSGCASMPDHGDLRGVESTPRQESQVRVFALPPRENAEAPEIVDGFLEALTSDDPDFETARKYLTAKAARSWRPEESLTVLAVGPESAERAGGGEDATDAVFSLSGRRVATVDGRRTYAPADGLYDKTLRLVREKRTKQWRIDSLPQGVVMGKSDFLRNYTSVNRYYFASNSPESEGQPVAVADPVYVRKKVDPLTQTVSLLLNGPSSWLDPVVRSSFPTGARLRKDVTRLTPDEENQLTVPLNVRPGQVSLQKCREMAAQLLLTVRDLTPTGVTSVELRGSDGSRLCAPFTGSDADNTVVHGRAKNEFQYFVDADHHLVRLPATGTTTLPAPVPGELGEGEVQLRAAAVSRDERRAAGVSLDGRELYVASLVTGASVGDPVLRSAGKTADDRFTTPSWDGSGDLWVADRDPANPRLLLLPDGGGEPVEVDTAGIHGRVDAVRVAADGVRIALIVHTDDQAGGQEVLYVGRIERGDSRSGEATVSVVEPRAVTPQLVQVTAMSWAGDSRLVVVGREHGGVQQMAYVQVDGSTPPGSAPAALTGVKALAASEDDQLPLMAYTEEDGIVRLSSGSKWQQVVEEGSSPVYPG